MDKASLVSLNPTFPFCFYGPKGSKNQDLKTSYMHAYQESYCNAFQTTFNELGTCYTINNLDQGFDEDKGGPGSGARPLLQVKGCGKSKGLKLVLDSQRLSSMLPKGTQSKGFKVFVTLPGVTTSKVPFLVNPSFKGEHNFYIHGIHVIKVINLLILLAAMNLVKILNVIYRLLKISKTGTSRQYSVK